MARLIVRVKIVNLQCTEFGCNDHRVLSRIGAHSAIRVTSWNN
jgi:hypothetical protein